MLNDIAFVALFFYLIGAFFQASTFICPSNRLKWWVLGFGFIAVCLHALLLHVWIDIAPGQNLNFFNLFSLMTWLIALFVLVVATQKPIELLTLIIFPLNALSIGFILLFPKQAVINTLAHPDTLFHILLSVFSFCVLCFAGLCAILLGLQEYCLRHKKMPKLMAKMPALESMEILLFQIISLGFILLSAVLMTSFYFYHTILFAHFYLLRKASFTTLAWLVFAILLLGKFQKGWRVSSAIFGTFLGVFLLMMAIGFKNGI